MVDSTTAIRHSAAERGVDERPREARGRVLVTDRRRLYREALAHLLAATPGVAHVATTATLEEALDACRADPFDAVLVHIDSLPNRRPEAAAELVDERPTLRVVIVTEEGEVLDEADEATHAYVSSTDPLEHLVTFVRSVAVPHDTKRRPAGERGSGTGRYVVPSLTPRELEVLEVLASGMSTEEGAQALHVSPLTIRSHVKSILGKLGVHSKLEAVSLAHRLGMISLPSPS